MLRPALCVGRTMYRLYKICGFTVQKKFKVFKAFFGIIAGMKQIGIQPGTVLHLGLAHLDVQPTQIFRMIVLYHDNQKIAAAAFLFFANAFG